MRTLILILLTLVSVLRLGGPVPCACAGEFGMVHGARAPHDEPAHIHEASLGCDGCADSCDGCLRCQAESSRPTDTSIPRVIEAQRHRATVLPSLILEAFNAAAALHESSNARRLAESSHTSLRPPAGVDIVRVTVRVV
jgi:hypothetical protein